MAVWVVRSIAVPLAVSPLTVWVTVVVAASVVVVVVAPVAVAVVGDVSAVVLSTVAVARTSAVVDVVVVAVPDVADVPDCPVPPVVPAEPVVAVAGVPACIEGVDLKNEGTTGRMAGGALGLAYPTWLGPTFTVPNGPLI